MRDVGEFMTNCSHVVAEERYVQNPTSPRRRRELRSDFLLVKTPRLVPDWFQFRDMFEVDGQPVRDRDARLSRLFLQPGAPRRLRTRSARAGYKE